jgi:hypothetical protein
MNAEQLARIQQQANGDPQRMVELIVDHHLATTYNGDVNAYVDGLGQSVARMPSLEGIQGLLPFLAELKRRGAAQDRIAAVIALIRSKIAAPPSEKAVGARRSKTKTGRRVRKGTRRGRTARS